MAKVTFEFDEDEELDSIRVIANRHKLCSALYEISNLRRSIYKGYTGNSIIVKDDSTVITGPITESYDNLKSYIKESWILDELDRCLNGLDDLIY